MNDLGIVSFGWTPNHTKKIPKGSDGEENADAPRGVDVSRIPGITPPPIAEEYDLGIPQACLPNSDESRLGMAPMNEHVWGEKMLGIPRVQQLPVYTVFQQFLVPDPQRIAETCLAKTVLGAAAGGVMGLAFGVVMSSFEGMSPPVTMPGQPEPPKKTWKQELREGGIKMKAKSKSWGKNFMTLTAMFQGFECAMSKMRAKHDIYNSVSAGCFTGATLARQSGPQAMALGCAGFAAFSAVIDTVMGTH